MYDMSKTSERKKRQRVYGVATSMMLETDLYDAIGKTATEHGVSKGVVIRDWLNSGRTCDGAAYADAS